MTRTSNVGWSTYNTGIRGDDLIDALVKEWDEPGHEPKQAGTGSPLVMIANPKYDPDASKQIVEHLLAAARGTEPGEERSYFTGRSGPLEQIVDWMNAGEPSIFVVTGPAGSGKSAIVGRILSLSNPEERARLMAQGRLEHADPMENSVDAHVHARGLTAESVVAVLDEQLVRRGVFAPTQVERTGASSWVPSSAAARTP